MLVGVSWGADEYSKAIYPGLRWVKEPNPGPIPDSRFVILRTVSLKAANNGLKSINPMFGALNFGGRAFDPRSNLEESSTSIQLPLIAPLICR